MLSLHGLSAWIEVDGRELEQYGVEEDLDRNRVTCWIATQANKNFSVVFKDNAVCREHLLGSYLELDGSSISGKVLRPPVGPTSSRTVVQKGQVTSVTSERPFVFSKLELTDDDEYMNQSSTRLGEIRISIYRAEPLGRRLVHSYSNASGHDKVHERSKKAVTHCVSYGQEVQTAAQYNCLVRHLDGNIALATFIFKYRDLGLLQANGIIPKPPPAKREASAFGEVLDLTMDDDDSHVKREPIRDEIEVVGGSTEKRVPSKRSNPSSGGGAQPSKRIKRETKFVPTGEIIDLT